MVLPLARWAHVLVSWVSDRVWGVEGRGFPASPMLRGKALPPLGQDFQAPVGGLFGLQHIQHPIPSFCLALRDKLIMGVCVILISGRRGKGRSPSPPTMSAFLFSRFPTSSGAWGSVTLVRGGILGGEDESGEALLCPGALPGYLL